MKYIWLIAFLFMPVLMTGRYSDAFAQEKQESAWADFFKGSTIAFRSDYDFNKESFIESASLNLPILQARASIKNPQEVKSYQDFSLSAHNYGISLTTQKLLPLFPITIKAGNLSQTGSISRLNSPSLSSSLSAFSSAFTNAQTLQASLPSYSSFSKAQGYFLQAGFAPKKIIRIFDLSSFYDDQNFICCANLKFSPFKKVDFSLCTTGGIFDYQKKRSDSWFLTEDFYNKGQHLCFNNQLCVSSNKFSSLFIVSTYETPFCELANTWRSENVIKFRHFTFNLSGFYNPNELVITSSDKKLYPLLQIKSGAKYQFIMGQKAPVICASVFNLLADINLNETEHTLKSAFGFKLTGANITSQLTANINANVKNQPDDILIDFAGASVQTTNSFYIKNLKSVLSGKFTFTPNAKKTEWTYSEKCGINFEYSASKGSLWFCNKNQITFTQKPQELQTQINYSCNLSARFLFKFCSLYVHLDFLEL